MILVIMVAAFVLPSMAQNYEAQQPNSAFQSTSTLMGSGSSLSSNPTINENGTASAPSYSPARAGSSPRKSGLLPGEPTNKDGDPGNVPIGEPWVLAIFAAAFAAVIAVRRKRAALKR